MLALKVKRDMKTTDNYKKHTSKNPAQQFLLKNFFNTLLDTLNGLRVRTVLDAGCGEGFTLVKLHEHKIGTKLEGIEFSKGSVDLGKKMYPYLNLKQGSIYKLSHKNNSIDLVICTEVLEHVEDPIKALKELVRVSKKYLLLSVPNEPVFMVANFARGKNWSRWGNDREHIQHWSSWSFEEFIKKNTHNVSVVVKKHPFPWTIVLLEKNQ